MLLAMAMQEGLANVTGLKTKVRMQRKTIIEKKNERVTKTGQDRTNVRLGF